MEERTIYALGFFDGVHLGHQALLAECRRMADSLGCKAGVVTFLGHPDTVVSGAAMPLINTPSDRGRLLRQYGMDTILELPFDKQLMTMSYLTFFRMLVKKYHAAGLVCGHDFRFGYRGEGDAEKLAAACREQGIPCSVVRSQKLEGITVSSTHIRSLLAQGDVETAARFLGHPHIFTGTVVPGRKLGRTLGIPTANLVLPEGVLIPRFGVYACRPTVGGGDVTVEPWILDFQGDLYGRELTLEFFALLRPERKFPSLEALKEEIIKNAAQTRRIFEKR